MPESLIRRKRKITMNSLKDIINEHKYLKFSLFIAGNAAILYALYFIIKNFGGIWTSFWGAFGNVMSALSPLWIGIVIAYILSPLVDIIDKQIIARISFRTPKRVARIERLVRTRRLISIIITMALIIAIASALVYGLAFMIIGNLMVDCIAAAIDSIIEYAKSYEKVIQAWANNLPEGLLSEKLQNLVQGGLNWFAENFHTTDIVNFIVNLGGGVVNLVLGIIVAIYLLYDKKMFLELLQRFIYLTLPSSVKLTVTGLLKDANEVISQFLRAACLDAVIVGVISSIALSIIGLDFGVFIGCFAGICNVIPYFGPIIGMIPAFIVGTFSEGLVHGIIAVGALMVIQQIDSNLIYPKVVGAQTGLHPLFVLIAVTFMGKFAGIIGMLIAVPIAGVIRIIALRWSSHIDSRRSSKIHNE